MARQAKERETENRERKREDPETERVDFRKRGDTHGDHKRGKDRMTPRTIAVVSQ